MGMSSLRRSREALVWLLAMLGRIDEQYGVARQPQMVLSRMTAAAAA